MPRRPKMDNYFDTKPIRYMCGKLFQGKVSVRSDYVNQAIKQGKDLIIISDWQDRKEEMTIPNKEIKKKMFQISNRKFKMKYPPYEEYELIDFTWLPDNTNKLKQQKLL